MNEKNIISSIVRSREAWDKVKDLIEPQKELSPEGALIWNLAGDFYTTDQSAQTCDTEILKARIERTVTSNKLSALLTSILDNLPDCSGLNVAKEVLALRRHSIGLKLSTRLGLGVAGPEVNALIESYTKLLALEALDEDSDVAAETTVGVPVERLLSSALEADNLIKLWPKLLNDRCDGGVLRGHHILILARPEMGKTLVAINMVAGFLSQGLRVLYIANEEPPDDILVRLGCRLSGMSKYEIREKPEAAQAAIDASGADLFTIAPLSPGNFGQIEALCRKYRPDVVVLDQIRNIDARTDNRTEALENNAKSARNLGKRFNCLVVSITQAGDSATGRRVLGLGDVDGSNTGIPGAVDIIIGVGADDSMVTHNMRMLSFPKNKRGGQLSHEPFTCQIDPQLSRVFE
jgi:KaiC/GvpD/RAD55 family RecA-like ATPase